MDKKRRHKRSARRARTRDPVLPQEGFVRLPIVLAVYPIGRSTWWEGVRAGKYPQPVKLSANITAWRVEQIRKLIEASATPQA